MDQYPCDDNDVVSPVISVAFLRALATEPLRRLLLPYQSALQSLGLSLEHVCNDESWRRHIHDIVNASDGSAPPRLQEVLMALGALATPRGYAQLRRLVPSIVSHSPEGLSPENLAASIYLDHPAIFESAQRRMATGRQTLETFESTCSSAPPHRRGSEARSGLVRLVSSWLAERGGVSVCGLHVLERAHETWFHLALGHRPHSAIGHDCTLEPSSQLAEASRDAFIVLDHARGLLTIEASLAYERAFLAQALGQVYWADARHFRRAQRYTARPLRHTGSSAVRQHGLRWMRQVGLQQVRLRSTPLCAEVTWTRSPARPELDGLAPMVQQHRTIVAFRVQLDLHGRRQPVIAEVRLPSVLLVERWSDRELVEGYLRDAGFMRSARAQAVA